MFMFMISFDYLLTGNKDGRVPASLIIQPAKGSAAGSRAALTGKMVLTVSNTTRVLDCFPSICLDGTIFQ